MVFSRPTIAKVDKIFSLLKKFPRFVEGVRSNERHILVRMMFFVILSLILLDFNILPLCNTRLTVCKL